MAIMGKKRDQNAKRSPTRHSRLGRKPDKTRTVKPGTDKDAACESFMGQFRGLPCAVCGRRWFFKDENGKKILASGHHLLYRSTHPEYKMTKDNIIPLCNKHHVPFAHEQPSLFLEWLKENRPEAWAWRESHKNHLGITQ
jgi:hypothetical protein